MFDGTRLAIDMRTIMTNENVLHFLHECNEPLIDKSHLEHVENRQKISSTELSKRKISQSRRSQVSPNQRSNLQRERVTFPIK